MKKILFTLAFMALLLTGCQKEKFEGSSDNGGETIEVSFTAMLEKAEATRAVADNDGHAANVNHWVLQVYEAGENGALFYEEKRDVTAGTLTQTYELKLFKNQSYNLLFWADTKDSYNTADLRNVTTADLVANKDSRDAFSASVPYTSLVSESKNVTLTRPFAQLNIITCDLDELKAKVYMPYTYLKYIPKNLQVVATIPTTFNVMTQAAGTAEEKELTADVCYGGEEKFGAGALETTLFMDYIFASKATADIKNIQFSFKSNENDISYAFANIPLQRNYRTNIKGKLMSNDSEWTVTIDPEWETPDYMNSPVQSVSLDMTEMTLFVGDEEPLTATVFPDYATVKEITWESSDESVATVDEEGVVTAVALGTAVITATAIDGLMTPSHTQQSASCTVTVDHNYVTMAGLKWATSNVGATTPVEPGWYFSWGNTEGYIHEDSAGWVKASDGTALDGGTFSESNYKATTGYTLRGSIAPDSGNDAARVNWGMNWRMPSSAEFQALYEVCGGEGTQTIPSTLSSSDPGKGIYWLNSNQAYISDYTGVAGLLFVDESKTQLFFPVTGYGANYTYLRGESTGRYWSSNLDYTGQDNTRTAYKLYFTEAIAETQFVTTQCSRAYAVRAVKGLAE